MFFCAFCYLFIFSPALPQSFCFTLSLDCSFFSAGARCWPRLDSGCFVTCWCWCQDSCKCANIQLHFDQLMLRDPCTVAQVVPRWLHKCDQHSTQWSPLRQGRHLFGETLSACAWCSGAQVVDDWKSVNTQHSPGIDAMNSRHLFGEMMHYLLAFDALQWQH